MVPGDVIETKVFTYTSDQLGLNVRHWVLEGTFTSALSITEIARLFELDVAPLYVACLASDAIYSNVTAQKIYPGPAQVPGLSEVLSSGGSQATTIMPTQVSGIVTFSTLFAGRAYRGRSFIPFPPIGANGALSLPTKLYTDTVQLLADYYASRHQHISSDTPGQTYTLAPVLFHRKTGDVTHITNAKVQSKWATQRRRGSYGQHNFPST
jgi:hypothetical protein